MKENFEEFSSIFETEERTGELDDGPIALTQREEQKGKENLTWPQRPQLKGILTNE